MFGIPVLFNTHNYCKTKIDKGFNPNQAEALTEANEIVFHEAVEVRLATKEDIGLIRREMTELATQAEMQELRNEMSGPATKAETQELCDELHELRGDMKLIKWMVALVIIATVIPAIRDLLI